MNNSSSSIYVFWILNLLYGMYYTHIGQKQTYGLMYVVDINVVSNWVNADQRSVINVASSHAIVPNKWFSN